jgi:hypothetical protein
MGYTPHILEDHPGEYRVWTEGERRGPEPPYIGPVARIWGDAEWVYVSTDDYEGTAMINREALPKLIVALQRLEEYLAGDPTTLQSR